MSLTAMKIFVLANIPNIWELANTPKINEDVSGIGTLESGTFELLLLVAFACLIRLATDEKKGRSNETPPPKCYCHSSAAENAGFFCIDSTVRCQSGENLLEQ